ncbi:MAG: TVP38/TMEM64 family protein [Candidatus Magasanikbacteria bacterium]
MKTKNIIVTTLVIALFVVSAYYSQQYTAQLKQFIGGDNIYSMSIYVLITIIAIVVAPIGTVPLVPMVGNMWGWFVGGLLSIIGWTVGGIIAFVLAKKYGYPLVSRLASVEKIQKIESNLPEKSRFWLVVFLRMAIPVDVLSYGLGLFSKMNTWKYAAATFIGVSPFGFLMAYAGTAPLWFQILAIALGVVAFLVGSIVAKEEYNKKNRNKT